MQLESMWLQVKSIQDIVFSLQCLTNLVWLPHDHERNSNSIDNNTSVIIVKSIFIRYSSGDVGQKVEKQEQNFVSEPTK